MTDRSPIEWTDATWNPIGGCTRVSEGCRNCYAEILAARFSKPGQWGHGLAEVVRRPDGQADHRWTGTLVLHEAALDRPLRWRGSRRIFVNSTSDLFHEAVPDDWIDRVFAVMALAGDHTFQILTKRPERARAYLSSPDTRHRLMLAEVAHPTLRGAKRGDVLCEFLTGFPWPLPHVWLGTSVEDQAAADARIPHLLASPAAVRFVSAEPLLGGLSLAPWLSMAGKPPRLDWVIVGGESSPGARVWPGFEDAARSLRDQCAIAGVAFFMKQMQGARKSAMRPIPPDLLVRQMPGVCYG